MVDQYRNTGINYYDIDRLCQEAVERNFKGEGNTVGSVISGATYALTWSAFTKYCMSQIENSFCVDLPSVGIVGFQPLRENKKIVYMRLSDAFLDVNQLEYAPQMEEFEQQSTVVLGPAVRKIDFKVISRTANLEPGTLYATIMNIFTLIGELLSENQNVEIDMADFGKFQGINGQVMYAPLNKQKPSGMQGKQTVKGLIDYNVSQGGRGGQLPPIDDERLIREQQQMYYQAQANFGYSSNQKANSLSAMLFKSQGQTSNHQATLNDSPTRRYKKPYNDGKINKELLGAGDDPMAKNQEFSLLASDPRALMSQNFKKPSKAQSRFPPVIDAFSRTLAAPVSSQRHYLSVSHRIGTNLTPSGKGFYIDVETRVVRYKDINDAGTKLDIVSERDIQPAEEAEEYEAVMSNSVGGNPHIHARKVSYHRYRQYIENEIQVDVIAPIRQYWLTHIIELIPGDLHAVEKDRIEYLIDTMLNEINKDYFDSVRKSILDYILMDEAEMKRLGIQQVINKPVTWGDDFYKGIEPNEEWKHNVMMARMLMSENLCICSQATLELMRMWREKDYCNTLLVDLLKQDEQSLPLEGFINRQKNQIEKVKHLLNKDWKDSAVDILREELENLDKDQTQTFFDSVATLMSNQARELITKSINEYVDFFRRFKKDKQAYPLPEEIIKREYGPDDEFEQTFLTLKLDIRDTEIIFNNSLSLVQEELVSIVKFMIERINNIPRADNQIANSDKTHLWDIDQEDIVVRNAQDEISQILLENLKVTAKAVNVYDEYLFLLKEQERVETFLNKSPKNLEEYQAEIQKYLQTIDKIRNTAPFEIRLNMCNVECFSLNQKLIEKCNSLILTILKDVNSHINNQGAALNKECKDIRDNFQKPAKESKDLVEYEEDLEKIRQASHQNIIKQYQAMVEWLQCLYQYPLHYEPNDELSKLIKPIYTQVQSISGQIEERTNALGSQRKEIEQRLLDEIKAFEIELSEVKGRIDAFKDKHNVRVFADHLNEINSINERLRDLTGRQKGINQKQVHLEFNVQEFNMLDTCKKNIVPYEALWTLASEVDYNKKAWENAIVSELDPEEVANTHKKLMRDARKLENTFDQMKNTKVKEAAKRQKNSLDVITPKIPMIRALCTPGLKENHIQRIGQKLKLDAKQDVTKQQLQNLDGYERYINFMEEVADEAAKQFANENSLKNMKRDWEPLEFTTKPWKETGSHILEGEAVENLTTALDDHIIKTQTMRNSPYIGPFKEEVFEWETLLQETQENLEVWISVQGIWCYLEPVFASEDIKKQMPNESHLFQQVNQDWRDLMAKVYKEPAALSVIKIPNIGKMLTKSAKTLEEVQKGLNQYLESKQDDFPRFYFLSSDELLEILSETREPLRVQPHLKKCFEGIDKLHFDDEKKIHAMFSKEGEKVPFTKLIDPGLCNNAVEKWLLQVEDIMLKSVKEFHEKSMQDYNKQTREKWCISWQGMAVLCVAMMFWTSQAEESMKKSGMVGLKAFSEKLDKQLVGLVNLVRSDITKLQRLTLEALVVLDVHAKEVIQKYMVDEGISSANDFAWLKQLRYYWEDNDVSVKITNSVLGYNHEYLGNSNRLVITPLTDRCYITLCGAIYLNYGGAPEGPAGTGKTETVKDLAKALARHCIVFNCSGDMDYKQMSKFFKGLASCGAWSCFDEFNRIELEVLSVIAQQLQCIQKAVDKKLKFFEFDDKPDLPLKLSCNCYITMNPGYAGRSALPDNLKALFRTVAMMVPDYAMIAEISLYSFGFIEGKALATKIVTTYTLCSEQLSSQKHYDYGMRAVKSVLTAAGNLKRKFPNDDESEILLRAINDVNLAKFLAHDLPLFRNITSDLFPGTVLPEPDYKDLTIAMQSQAKKMNLQEHPYFFMKVIELYEMTIVRHGLMVVGEPFSGKTMALRVLQGALTELNQKGLMDERKTHITRINPKSITMGQLYGKNDEISHDWVDGVLAVSFRDMANKMDVNDKRWLVFDGPVDALWIENMNTVLDDNKKLCLNSGEIIQMTNNMNMIFEPMDLLVASPATVSRCGMVYMQPRETGWRPLYESWLNTLPEFLTQLEDDQPSQFMKNIIELVDVIVQPCIDFVRNECSEVTPTNDQALVQALLRLWSAQLKVFNDPNFTDPAKLERKTGNQIIDSCFLFAVIWSLCITVSTDDRRPFDLFFKKVCDGSLEGIKKFAGNKKLLPSKMDRGLIYDYCYHVDRNEWEHWMDPVNKETIDAFPKEQKPSEIVVTTIDVIRYSFLQKFCIHNEIPTLFVGNTGTGKTTYIQNVLSQQLDKEIYGAIEIGFSAQTGCNQVQEIIDGKVEKRRAGYFGASLGKKIVIFVDDLNMPKTEFYGAQPPIEILRQLLDQGGWYDLKDSRHPFRNFVDTMLICAMGPPGGGKSFISPRLQRHFNVISLATFDDNTMKSIYTSILKWFFREGKFATDIANLDTKIVDATLQIYKQIQLDLKPTPLKSHYTFNLRDFGKVIQGICLVTQDTIKSADQALRLWAHETTRVLGDRLINDADRMWMLESIQETTRTAFGVNFDLLFKHLDKTGNGKIETFDEFRGNLFGDIFSPFGIPDRPYEEILDKQKLIKAAEDALGQYNDIADNPMNLVLFNFAIEHLLRISRILKQDGGHALLVGVGGSGRQSLSRLSARMADIELFQIEIKKQYTKIEFREDLKVLMKSVGGKGETTCAIFNDNSIKDENFLEDINNILNTGEVPNIFNPEEKDEVCQMVQAPAKDEGRCENNTPKEYFAYFVERAKANLHICMAFSPIGEVLRNRIRNFPSLVNCTTIDWFSEWPKDALESVAQKFLGEIELEDEVRLQCVAMVQTFHTTTQQSAQRFLRELQRHFYVTPTSYLELINSFKRLLEIKRQEISTLRDKYKNGYNILIETEGKVGEMQETLEAMKPQLIEKSKEVDEQATKVEAEAGEAEKVRAVVDADAAKAQVKADAAQAIKDDCQKDLAEAEPALKAAEKALGLITKKDISLLKTTQIFNPDVYMVLSSVCVLMKVEPERKMDPATQKRVTDYTAPAKKMMMNQDFLTSLTGYPKEELTQALIDKIQVYVSDEKFTKQNLWNNNQVAANLCEWVCAMDKFYRVNEVVKPKKAQLAVAQAEYDEVNGKLEIKKAELRKVQAKVDGLKAELKAAMDEKSDLQAKVKDCEDRLVKATKLIDGLGGEKSRWSELSVELSETYIALTGDVLISSGMIAYLGAFNSVFRNELTEMWVKNCQDKEIPNSGKFSLAKTLGNDVTIRDWTIDGLPSDNFSVENAIITFNTSRWPLYIDPQGQANKWIKTMGKKTEKGIKIMKFSDNNYLKQLEAAIQFGLTVLIENVGVELDPAIEPVLQKQIIVKGQNKSIKIGENIIPYADEFNFYISTKLRNPHYLPEVSTKVTLLNFMITYEGLTDQLLGIVVAKENPELEEKNANLIRENAEIRRQLAKTEADILQTLSATDDILGDEAAIEVLSQASLLSVEVAKKKENAAKTEAEIETAREQYRPVALRTSGLFFCIQDLAFIDPMYQYSLPFFVNLFDMAIAQAEKSDEIEERLGFLNAQFLEGLFKNVCVSLFEKDKLIFSFLLCIKLLELNGTMDSAELKFLLTGGVALGEDYGTPPAEWLTAKMWGEIHRMSKLNSLRSFLPHFEKQIEAYHELYQHPNPEQWEIPKDADMINQFRKLMVIRAIRPDKLVPAVSKFITDFIGEFYIKPPAFELANIFLDSRNIAPLIFVLSPGADPLQALMKFAGSKNKNPDPISLGQGQGPRAEAMIEQAKKDGEWVVLQNCHLATSWMKKLEKICEDFISEPLKVHREFRLWLTSYPSESFPVSILQNGVKMTREAKQGLSQNLQDSYGVDPISDPDWFGTSTDPQKFRKLLFGMVFFHAVIQERRLYGPLGWNIRYEFNETDLRISVRQLKIFLEHYPEKVPFEALKYLTAECNYGGRVTDKNDRVTIMVLLNDYFNDRIFDDDYKFSPSGIYYAPKFGDSSSYVDYAKQLPLFPEPEVFGFHPNAAITKNLNETNDLLSAVTVTKQDAGGSGDGDQDAVITALADSILSEVPEPFDLVAASKKYPTSYEQSLNSVLTQELGRFNGLIKAIKSSLKELKKAIKGEALLSSDLEETLKLLQINTIPNQWLKHSFVSMKPLGSYVKEVIVRLEFFKNWLDNSIPDFFYINRFFFVHGFLTGARQNYARKYTIPIDTMDMEFKILRDQSRDKITPPENGIFCCGMYMEGFKWNQDLFQLEESDAKVLFTEAPMVHFLPIKAVDKITEGVYNAPMYLTMERKGTLATTGHSTNFVLYLSMPTDKDPSHWIKRGAALICSLSD